MTLEEAREHVGSEVVYKRPLCEAEDGVITSVSESFVFVRYAKQHLAAPGQATDPADLTLLASWAVGDG